MDDIKVLKAILKVGIVILNYNNWKDTVECIKSIKLCGFNGRLEVILVDNASTVHEPDFLEGFCLANEVNYVKCTENRGYSAGNNVGVAVAISSECDYVIVSNNDIIYEQGSLNKMIELMERENGIDILGPKIVLNNNVVQEVNMHKKTTLFAKYRNMLFRYKAKEIGTPFVGTSNKQPIQGLRSVFAVSGCCMLFRAESLKSIFPLDERIFLYLEEYLIGLSAANAGLKTAYCENVSVIHKHGQSTGQVKAFAYACMIESEMYYFSRILNANLLACMPLYLYRISHFMVLALRSDDYRSNIRVLFNKISNVFK